MMILEEKGGIVQHMELRELSITLKEDGIVYIHYKDHTTVDTELQSKALELYQEITKGKPTPCVFEAGQNFTVTKEARENAILIESQSPCSAMGFVVDNLTHRLITSSFLKFNKPKTPCHIFSNKEQAVTWLNTFF